jgi:acyl carrier protein
MQTQEELAQAVKTALVTTLKLKTKPEEIPNDKPLFGPDSLGLDSIDALQVVVLLEKNFGLTVRDADVAKKALVDVNSIVAAIQADGQ